MPTASAKGRERGRPGDACAGRHRNSAEPSMEMWILELGPAEHVEVDPARNLRA